MIYKTKGGKIDVDSLNRVIGCEFGISLPEDKHDGITPCSHCGSICDGSLQAAWEEGEVEMKTWEGPKSICQCGHTGDGSNSQHADTIVKGHGACMGCDCKKFTWKAFTPAFDQFIRRER